MSPSAQALGVAGDELSAFLGRRLVGDVVGVDRSLAMARTARDREAGGPVAGR